MTVDAQKFDGIARTLATGSSRRSVLRGLAGGALAAVGLSRAAQAVPMDKVDLCHYDADTDTYHSISVSGNALDAHLAHGDFLDEGTGCVPAVYHCYWLSNQGEGWIIGGFADENTTEAECIALDSCSPGGGGQSGGGCYQWSPVDPDG